jgi:hypothetical protein
VEATGVRVLCGLIFEVVVLWLSLGGFIFFSQLGAGQMEGASGCIGK